MKISDEMKSEIVSNAYRLFGGHFADQLREAEFKVTVSFHDSGPTSGTSGFMTGANEHFVTVVDPTTGISRSYSTRSIESLMVTPSPKQQEESIKAAEDKLAEWIVAVGKGIVASGRVSSNDARRYAEVHNAGRETTASVAIYATVNSVTVDARFKRVSTVDFNGRAVTTVADDNLDNIAFAIERYINVINRWVMGDRSL